MDLAAFLICGFPGFRGQFLRRNRRLAGELLFKPIFVVTKKSGYGPGYECKKATKVGRGSIPMPALTDNQGEFRLIESEFIVPYLVLNHIYASATR